MTRSHPRSLEHGGFTRYGSISMSYAPQHDTWLLTRFSLKVKSYEREKIAPSHLYACFHAKSMMALFAQKNIPYSCENSSGALGRGFNGRKEAKRRPFAQKRGVKSITEKF